MNNNELSSWAKSLTEGAISSSVSEKLLLNETANPITNNPLISYLFEDEQPHYCFKLTGTGVTIKGDDGTDEFGNVELTKATGVLAFTDMRVLIVVNGQSDGVISIPLREIENATYTNAILMTSSLSIKTSNFEYELSLEKNLYDAAVDYLNEETGKNQDELEEVHYMSENDSVFVCKKCKQEVSPEAEKCPHCGYYPGKGGKGALWHLSSVFVWPMAVKGAADEMRARRGVAEESKRASEPAVPASFEEDPLDKIERLSEMRDKGIITSDEFEAKKKELLDEI